MFRNKPKLKYCGLTVILSNPSRFDEVSLLTSTGGNLFNSLLQPEFNTMQCDLRLVEDRSPFISETKCIALLGESAMHEWCKHDTRNNTLNEMRGSPLYVDNIPAITSFFPQDAADFKSYEQQLNKESKDYTGEEEGEEEEDEGDVKKFSNTKRSNYAFWLGKDIAKCKKILHRSESNPKWEIEREPVYRIYPGSDEIINVLENTKEHYLYIDIETDYEEQNLLCFSFGFYKSLDDLYTGNLIIYCIPVLNTDYHWAYSSLCFIIRALVVAIKDNIVVAHNGAGFDFFVFAAKYHIPVYRTYDTMIAQHRCFPDIEKSLGHCTSLWTNQRFHKDTDSRAYFTQEHMMKKLQYCGKDVFTMFLIHRKIEEYARTIPGLVSSIKCAMSSIRPYLITTLLGIRYSQEKVEALCKENDSLMEQYIRIINMLIGPVGLEHCRKAIKSKAKAFPGSNTQCADYFHDQLGYPVLFRSSKTQKPSLGKKIMYKLALKYPDNPVITFVLLYRTIAKEYGALKFNPWKDDNNKILPRRKAEIEE